MAQTCRSSCCCDAAVRPTRGDISASRSKIAPLRPALPIVDIDFERAKPLTAAIWKRFRNYPLFVQLLLVVPILCAMALTLLVGNMGLALMGTAIAINAVVVGWVGGVLVLVLGKAGIIVAKDHNKKG